MRIPVSVVIVTYRRMSRLAEICKSWLDQSPDVWLCDCSKDGAADLPAGLKIARFSPDPGNRSRHAIALLTSGDYVIKADDDVIALPGLIDDFLRFAHPSAILGLMGRTFSGPKYYGLTHPYRAREIFEPIPVGMVGIVTFSPRSYLAFDLKGCSSSIEDLFWQMKGFPSVRKFVIPTKRYQQIEESNDPECLFLNPSARVERENFYREYFLKLCERKK